MKLLPIAAKQCPSLGCIMLGN